MPFVPPAHATTAASIGMLMFSATPSYMCTQDVRTHVTKQHFFHVCLRLQVGVDISMHDIVGKLVHVFWPAEDDWFLATVASYDENTMQHLVCLGCM